MFKIFDKLGGKDAALDVLERRMGLRPGVNALKRWNRLRRCSHRATVAFLQECQERGIPFDASDCTRDEPVRARKVLEAAE